MIQDIVRSELEVAERNILRRISEMSAAISPIPVDLRVDKELVCPHCQNTVELITERKPNAEKRVLEYVNTRGGDEVSAKDVALALELHPNSCSNMLAMLYRRGQIGKVTGTKPDKDGKSVKIVGLYRSLNGHEE